MRGVPCASCVRAGASRLRFGSLDEALGPSHCFWKTAKKEAEGLMRCDEIMQRRIEYVTLQDSVEKAAERMRDMDIGFLPVCDAARHVLGTLTDRDVALRVVADKRPSSTHVGDVMTREVVACRPSDDIERAEQLLRERKKSRILCTDDRGRLM